ncbi:MAG: ABC transporter permease [Deltaproteobacteria bacterium]|nr:ABC transporter permease [Deltaproteobacteria bacterium]
MSLWQALAYFFREALVSLGRSWKVSSVAILTIAVSLFVGGVLLLLSTNLATVVGQWRSQAKVLVYLTPEVSQDFLDGLRKQIEAEPWVTECQYVAPEDARERFRQSFPSLSGMVEDWQEEPLPASFEISLDPTELTATALEEWLSRLREEPQVEMVDDDRDWLSQLSAIVALIKGIGITLGAVLLGAAIFTIASVIRLTAYLYQDEITIMRVVGATEFFIRGPFYVEGFLQGLIGGSLALAGLHLGHAVLLARTEASIWGGVLLESFLSPQHQLALIVVGGLSGLGGAILSLRRETLVPAAEGT